MSKKRRVIFFLIFVGVFLAAFSVGATYRMSDDEARTFLKEFRSQTKGISGIGIFAHNLSVALPMFIPGFGVGWGAYTGWSTGAGFHVIVATNPTLAGLPPVSLLVSTPFGIMELVAYSLAMSQSCLLVLAITKRTIREELRPTAIEIGIMIVLLIAGGLIEHVMLGSANQG